MEKTTECKKLGEEETAADSYDGLLARKELAVAKRKAAGKKLAEAKKKFEEAEKKFEEAQKTWQLSEDLAADEKKKEDVKAGIVSDEEQNNDSVQTEDRDNNR